jgi:PDZ domain
MRSVKRFSLGGTVVLLLGPAWTGSAFSPSCRRRISVTATGVAAPSSNVAASDAHEVHSDLLVSPDATICTFSLAQHRPMGCTVEESLSAGYHVFISAVKEGGNADVAGVQVGDVIVGVTGLFGGMEDVTGLGLEKV